ncbi:MAG: CvpA family protein [Alphaproteobacteria bacterium]|nr:CvpA family protein [Alphaproteobacteria bacterium]
MTDLHINGVDLAVAAILILSVFFAIYRGFVRETLSVFAWAAAAFATLYFGRYVAALLTSYMSEMLAEVVGHTAVFLLILIPLAFFANRISWRVQESPVGFLDRAMGALFGVVRGLVVIAVLYIVYSLLIPVPVQAKWMKEARTLPLIQNSASVLLDLLPDDDAQYLQERTQRSSTVEANLPDRHPSPNSAPSRASHTLPQKHKPARKGYGAAERRALDRLIENSGSGSEDDR